MPAHSTSDSGRGRAGTWRTAAFWSALAIVVLGTSVAQWGRAASIPLSSKPLTIYRTCMLTANPNTSTAEIDSYVNQSSANANTGTAVTLDSRSGNGSNRRIYLRFDLTKCRPSIPSSATVTNALLRLYVTVVPGACRTEDIFRTTASWTETGVTWNNQPFGTSINNPPSAQRTDFITVGSAPCQNTATNAYVTGWNLVADAQAFVAGSATNYGWMIRDDVENSGTVRTATFSAKDSNLLAQSPQLVITYRV